MNDKGGMKPLHMIWGSSEIKFSGNGSIDVRSRGLKGKEQSNGDVQAPGILVGLQNRGLADNTIQIDEHTRSRRSPGARRSCA